MKKCINSSWGVFLLRLTTNITAYALDMLLSTSFRTNLIKGGDVDEEVLESEKGIYR